MKTRRLQHRFKRWTRAWPTLFIVGAVALMNHYGVFAVADGWLLDSQFRLLRATRPQVVSSRVVVIAIDEATLKASKSPLALWHPHYGQLFEWLATAKPRAVGFDIVLPARGYEQRFPGTDRSLMRGLRALRQAGIPVVVAHSIDENRKPRPIYGPFLSLVEPRYGIGSDVLIADADRVVRRHTEVLGVEGGTVPTFAGQLVRAVGGHYTPGLLDYRMVQDIPVISALSLFEKPLKRQKVLASLANKVVIIGSILSDIDRLALPLPLLPSAVANRQPGVIVQANVVSALLNRSLMPLPARWPGRILLASSLLLWPAATRARRAGTGLVLFVLAVYGLTLGLLMHSVYLPSAAALAGAALLTLTHLLIRTYRAQKAVLIARTRVDAQKDFVNAVSHDLCTPVGALLSTVELVKKAKDDRTRNRYLAWLQRAASVFEHEVDELLALSKIEDADYRPPEAPLDLYALVTALYASALPLAAAKGLTLGLAVSAGVAPSRRGAETAITRLLQNVLSNALKYSKQGCISLRVMPGANTQTARFEIEDEAGGIPPDKITHLFDKYQRFNDDMPGIGLGMAIVRKLVDSLEGKLRIDSVEGRGTTIHITLPLKLGETQLSDPAPVLPSVVVATRETGVRRTLEAMSLDVTTPAATTEAGAVMITDTAVPAASSSRILRILSDQALHATGQQAIWRFGQGAEVSRRVNAVTMRRLLYLAALDGGLMAQTETPTVGLKPKSERRQRRVLLVDDNEIVRLAWSELLTGAGYRVTLAACGSEAIEQLKKSRFDILILDQHLPDRMGTTLAEAIRRLEGIDPRLPILLATSDPMTAVTASTAVITQQLPKTIAPDELLAKIDRLLDASTVGQVDTTHSDAG